MFPDEVYQIEDVATASVSEENSDGDGKKSKPKCSHCKDNEARKCRHCGCYACGGKSDPDKQLLCDECDMAYHLGCLDPPLESVPEEDEWYCPECKNDENAVIRAGEKLRFNKKKAKMMSKKSDCKRDWGKVIAHVNVSVCSHVLCMQCKPIEDLHNTHSDFRVTSSVLGSTLCTVAWYREFCVL